MCVYGCFQKWWYPQIIHFNRVFHYKPSILGYPHFWKHPYTSSHLNKWNAFNDIILVYLSQVFLPKCANQESCFASFLRCDFWQTPLSVRNSKKFKHSWKRLHISRARICCTGKIIHWRRIWRFVLFVSP